MSSRAAFRVLLAGAFGALGCVPDFDDDTTLVAVPRVLAVRADPAEVRERVEQETTFTALVAEPEAGEAPDPFWSLCIDRKPLSELGPVSQRCLASPEPGEEIAQPLGAGTSVVAPIPANACQLFGPQRPDPKPGQPAGRPVDPDPTGGFYQPVLAWLDATAVLGAVRLGCPLRDADFNRRYRQNANPDLSAFELVRADGSVLAFTRDDPDAELTLAPGERVTLRTTWPSCPAVDVCGDDLCGPDEDTTTCQEDCAVPRGCSGAERYAYFDALEQKVTERWETLTVSYYATGGAFDAPRSSAADGVGADGSPGALNGYAAPSGGSVAIWAIVRDDRGGTAWQGGKITISK